METDDTYLYNRKAVVIDDRGNAAHGLHGYHGTEITAKIVTTAAEGTSDKYTVIIYDTLSTKWYRDHPKIMLGDGNGSILLQIDLGR